MAMSKTPLMQAESPQFALQTSLRAGQTSKTPWIISALATTACVYAIGSRAKQTPNASPPASVELASISPPQFPYGEAGVVPAISDMQYRQAQAQAFLAQAAQLLDQQAIGQEVLALRGQVTNLEMAGVHNGSAEALQHPGAQSSSGSPSAQQITISGNSDGNTVQISPSRPLAQRSSSQSQDVAQDSTQEVLARYESIVQSLNRTAQEVPQMRDSLTHLVSQFHTLDEHLVTINHHIEQVRLCTAGFRVESEDGECKPAPCSIPSSNGLAGRNCHCANNSAGEIVWSGNGWHGSCTQCGWRSNAEFSDQTGTWTSACCQPFVPDTRLVQAALSTLPGLLYSFTDGTTGTYIPDGGGDMYDSGNYLYIKSNGAFHPVTYHDQCERVGNLGGGSTPSVSGAGDVHYSTCKTGSPTGFMAHFASATNAIEGFKVWGDLGSGQQGSLGKIGPISGWTGYFKYASACCAKPSVSHLILVQAHDWTNTQDSSNYDSDHQIVEDPSGTSTVGDLFYLMWGGAHTQVSTTPDFERVMRTLLGDTC